MGNIIKVGMADLNVCKAPDGLTTLGLGSCIGLTLYDPVTKIGGMVHYMLPDSTKVSNNSNKAKFADTGIEELLKNSLKEDRAKTQVEGFTRLNLMELTRKRICGKKDI